MTLAVCARTLQGQNGDTLGGAEVTVRVNATGDLADIFADRDGNTPAPNPLTASATGTVEFYVTPGVYRIEAIGAGGEETQVVDLGGVPVIPVATIADLQALNTDSLPDGQQVSVTDQDTGGVYRYDESAASDGIAPDSGGGRWFLVSANDQGRPYATRAAFEDGVAGGYAPADGTVVSAGGVQYVRSAGATALPGLGGWLPFGIATPEHFGALADGSGDDTAPVQAAIDYVSASGGASLMLKRNYVVSETTDNAAVRLKSNINIKGEGWSTGFILAENQNSTAVLRPVADAENIRLYNFSIDGNRANQSNPDGFLHGFTGSPGTKNINLDRILIKNVYGRAFMSSRPIGEDERNSENITVQSCKVLNHGGKGFQFNRTKGGSAVGCSVSVVADANIGSAFEVSTSSDISISSCQSYDAGNATNAYRVVNGANNVSIVGNSSDGGNRGLFVADATNIIMSSNVVKNCNSQGCIIGHTDFDNLGWECKNIKIIANTFDGFTDGLRASIDPTGNGSLIDSLTVRDNLFVNGTIGVNLTTSVGEVVCRESNNDFKNVTNALSGFFTADRRIMAMGYISHQITNLADDTAQSVEVKSGSGAIIVTVTDVPLYTALFAYRAVSAASRVDEAWNIAPTTVKFTTGELTGSTGSDGDLTFSAHTDGRIYVENRTGSSRTVKLTFLGTGQSD